MIFQADLAFATALIAFALGGFLFQQKAQGLILKIVSYVVLVGSALTLICISVNAYKAYSSGAYSMPSMRPMMMGPRNPGMMPQMMMPPKSVTPAPSGETVPQNK